MIYYGDVTTSGDGQLIAIASIAGSFAGNITPDALLQTANTLLQFSIYFGHQ